MQPGTCYVVIVILNEPADLLVVRASGAMLCADIVDGGSPADG